MRPAKTLTYLKRAVKEKWEEVQSLRKRRVRWTIGGDKIKVVMMWGSTPPPSLLSMLYSTPLFPLTLS
jgi:hypothetical protein